ncbi:sulfite exporter TauE/SafE family protein [Thiorhodococcus mannitoliphagus]|uniref:Probable membrane transporter protein n=1 Tax=Thiorhodococcus mannitoliphagus TaxID=329406 RepID=A0A6P1DWJ4_9GAMM|nr:sulfite exporter TauE/SafE family protein [Thiorhodococcus mannitoliphagus]NEX21371.1 sulfite exporter TauE/SafE family protein [Thiorhodococcus mannitoliphagus]
MPDLTFLPILLLAAFVHGAFGFGFPMVATPLLALFMDMRAAILLTLIPTVSINLASIFSERHWREALRIFWPIPTFTIVGSFVGTQVLLSVDPEPFRLLLALVLVAYLITDRFHRAERERRAPPWVLALLGLLLGLLAGVVNIFAPVLVIFALYTRMHPTLMVAAFNLSFVTSKTGQIIGFATNGAFDLATLKLSLLILPAVLTALWLGIRVRRRLHLDTYRRLLRYSLWAMAGLLVADWFWSSD